MDAYTQHAEAADNYAQWLADNGRSDIAATLRGQLAISEAIIRLSESIDGVAHTLEERLATMGVEAGGLNISVDQLGSAVVQGLGQLAEEVRRH